MDTFKRSEIIGCDMVINPYRDFAIYHKVHTICKNCFIIYLETSIADVQTIRCVNHHSGCNSSYDENEIDRIVSSDLAYRYRTIKKSMK